MLSELGLQREHLVLALLALRHQLDRRLAVRLEGDAAVGDLLAVGGGGVHDVGVALGHPLHHVELRDQLVEGARREEHVDDAGFVRLVGLAGARGEVLVGDAQLVLGGASRSCRLRAMRSCTACSLEAAWLYCSTATSERMYTVSSCAWTAWSLAFLLGDRARRCRAGEDEDEDECDEAGEDGPAHGGQTNRLLRAG